MVLVLRAEVLALVLVLPLLVLTTCLVAGGGGTLVMVVNYSAKFSIARLN